MLTQTVRRSRYPTLSKLAGASPDDPPAPGVTDIPEVDGFDMWPYITGAVAESPRTEVLISSGVEMSSGSGTIVSGDLKLIFGVQRLSLWQSPIYPNASVPAANSTPFDCGRGCLFNVTADPSEYDDLAAARPDDVARLTDRFHTLNATRYSPPLTQKNATACSGRVAVHHGFNGPYYQVSFNSASAYCTEVPSSDWSIAIRSDRPCVVVCCCCCCCCSLLGIHHGHLHRHRRHRHRHRRCSDCGEGTTASQWVVHMPAMAAAPVW